MILHISTEGATAGTIKQSRLGGSVFDWTEHWYEGPVPESLSRDDLDRHRIQYIRSMKDGKDQLEQSVIESSRERRKKLFAELPKYTEIVFWFNSTVGEQLNLLDVLVQLGTQELTVVRYTRVRTEGPPYQYRSSQLAEFGAKRTGLSAVLIDRASSAWQAFRTADPTVLERYIAANSEDLPELCAALGRFLEELPAVGHGLSRFEALILSALSKDELDAMLIMVDHSDEWNDPLFAYVDDRALQRYLLRLGQGPCPLIEFADGGAITPEAVWESVSEFFRRSLRLTPTGRRVLDGEDYLVLNKPRRWLGAYCLEPGYTDWRWDSIKRKVTVGSAW